MANYKDAADLYKSNRLVIQALTAQGYLHGIIVDAAIQEVHSLDNEITDHEVEEGSNITDHIRTKPREVSITGLITDDPSTYEAMYENVKDALKGENSKRSALALEFFDAIGYNKDSLTIFTKNKTYVGYYLKSFKEVKDKNTAHGMRFTASFREVKFVTTDYVTTKADTLGTTVAQSGQKKADKGTKKTKAVTPQKEVIVQDVANGVTDKWAGFKSTNVQDVFGGQ